MTVQTFAIAAAFTLAFALISGRLEKSIITAPMAFVAFGLLLSPQIFNLLEINMESELVQIIAELTLVLVLFTDAARIDLKRLKRQHDIPVRLLSIGLPLSIILGTILGVVLLSDEINFWEAAGIATILAPTDAALGQAVVSSPQVPARIRQALNVESGLNDGICLPILLIFLSLAADFENITTVNIWIDFTAKQVIFGPIAGIAIGYIGGWLITESTRKEWITENFQDISALGLSLLAYSLAELIGGNGFIAAFCAGLTLGNTAPAICPCLYEFGEAEGQLLTLITFTIYGSAMVLPVLHEVNWQIVLYAILSLTAVRMLSVAVSTIGMKLKLKTILFLGWFGPRGIASLLYALLVLERSRIMGREAIFATAMITVLISVFAHGLTAFPGANWYAKHMENCKQQPDVGEHMPVSEMPVRLPWRI